jgi:cytidylate kinase
MDSWVIAIDGPAGAGKSTIARMLAARLGAVFLDTGAMYRAVTAAAMEQSVDLKDVRSVMSLMDRTEFRFEHDGPVLRVFVNGRDFTDRIREPEVTEKVRYVACQGLLRGRLVQMQREFAARFQKVVTEGRDQGTVAFPEARWKFFLEADAAERARRRQKDLAAVGKQVSLEELQAQILSRDASDVNRSVGPLVAAADAVHIDTTPISAEQVVEQMLQVIRGEKHGRH